MPDVAFIYLMHSDDVLFSTVRTYLRNITLVPEKHNGNVLLERLQSLAQ